MGGNFSKGVDAAASIVAGMISGDMKGSVEYWKDKVRNTVGENTVSQITNGVLTAYGDTVDLGVGVADTVLDAVLALDSCTMGTTYCDTALKDLEHANQTAYDAVGALSSGKAWDSIVNTFAKAQQGDQKALEEIAGILSSVLAPSKIVSGSAGKAATDINKIDDTIPTKVINKTENSGATNVVNAPKLNAQLTAQEIANGHAFEKHVIKQGEFKSLGIRTREQFQQHVEKVINNPTDVRYYSDGRVAYLDSNTRTVVIRNSGKGESTAFRPDYGIGWDNYIKRLPTQKTPIMN